MSTLTEQAGEHRTTILTVDDDPGVSRAVARDLRRRYGERYRIMRAESASAGLDALRQMKLRGDLVAVILADYRMPELNGIEFLEQAMDIYPGARRVLLTAYADTGAAIDAINVVDLDHYLLKPWDPPEEKLYPVVDALLDARMESDHRPVPETKVVGHRWSARSSEVREFLARNLVPYRWYASDEPEGRRLLEAAGADGRALPVVITPDGEPLIEPADAELAERVGLAITPSKDFYDLIVIGGGPAGLGSAVHLARYARSVTLLARGPSLEKSMSYYLIKRITDHPSISVRTRTEIIGASGEDHLERLTLRDTAHGSTETVDAQWLYLFIGAEPLTDWLDGVVVRDDKGFVLAGPDLSPRGERPPGWTLDRMPYHLETSVPGVFVAGDARAESAKRVASAVGEGSMAVMLVHRYLEKL